MTGAGVTRKQENKARDEGHAAYREGKPRTAAPQGPILIRSAWLIGRENAMRATPLHVTRCALAGQLMRYQDKHGIPDSVSVALRDTLTPDGPADLAHHRRLVDALGEFLHHEGGDYGLRRAFDAFCVAVAGGSNV